MLGWPQATFLASIKLAADGKSATVTREVDAGVEEKRVRLPAVVTVDLRIIGKKAVRNEALAGADAEWEETQRYASLKGIMAAKKKEIKDMTLAELGVDAKIPFRGYSAELKRETQPAVVVKFDSQQRKRSDAEEIFPYRQLLTRSFWYCAFARRPWPSAFTSA